MPVAKKKESVRVKLICGCLITKRVHPSCEDNKLTFRLSFYEKTNKVEVAILGRGVKGGRGDGPGGTIRVKGRGGVMATTAIPTTLPPSQYGVEIYALLLRYVCFLVFHSEKEVLYRDRGTLLFTVPLGKADFPSTRPGFLYMYKKNK